MELKESLDFYKQCLKDCDKVLAHLQLREDLSSDRKHVLIDKMLDTRNKLDKLIKEIEDILMM